VFRFTKIVNTAHAFGHIGAENDPKALTPNSPVREVTMKPLRIRNRRKTRQTLREGEQVFVCRACETISRVGFVDLVKRNASTFCPECGEADLFPLEN
jgi:hypothetical protein